MPANISLIFSAESMKRHGKTLKHIRFLSESLLLEAAAGKKLDVFLPDGDGKGLFLQGSTLWLTKEERTRLPKAWQAEAQPALAAERVWAAGRVPRVTLNRLSSASEIYHAGRVTFAEECGLWFGVWWRNPDADAGALSYRQAFTRALTLLQDDGLGGERSSGYGAFHFEEQANPPKLTDPRDGVPAYLLNHYSPQGDELRGLQDERSAYALTSVSGWMRTFDGLSQRRRRLVMVTEGSLVCLTGEVCGALRDVAPQREAEGGSFPHPVYRAGFALALAWNKS